MDSQLEDFIKTLPQLEADMKKDSEKWVNLISIDPGFENLASCFGHYRANLEDKVVELEFDKKRMKSEYVMDFEGLKVEEMEYSLKKWVFQNFSKEDLELCSAFVEKQYILPFTPKNAKIWPVVLKLQVFQGILYTLLDSTFGVFTQLIPSSDCKQKLGICGKDRAENKRLAVKFANSLLTKEEQAFLDNNHHIADCINQAYYKLKINHQEVFGGEWKVIVKFVEFSK
jgi:hypothetical protein